MESSGDNDFECPACEGSGIDPNGWGCGDQSCCSTICWSCCGSGELESEGDDSA